MTQTSNIAMYFKNKLCNLQKPAVPEKDGLKFWSLLFSATKLKPWEGMHVILLGGYRPRTSHTHTKQCMNI